MWKKIINQEVYVVSHIICKATAADSFKTGEAESITLSSPPQKKNQNKKTTGKTILMNRENENWRACLLFKFKGSCSFQSIKPVNTLFSPDLKTHSKILFSNYLYLDGGTIFGYVFTFPPSQPLFIQIGKVYYTILLTVSKHFSGNIYSVFIALSPTILEASVQLLFFLDVTYITRDLPP